MLSAVTHARVYHPNNSTNHSSSHFFSLIKMLSCPTLLKGLFLLLVTDFFHSSPSFLSLSLSVYLTPSPVSHQHFSCHSDLVIRLSVLITALLITVHQIIIRTVHSDEVWGVIQGGPVKACPRFWWHHPLELEIIVPAKRVSAASVMWEHHAEVLHRLNLHCCTPISCSKLRLAPSCNMGLWMMSEYNVSAFSL